MMTAICASGLVEWRTSTRRWLPWAHAGSTQLSSARTKSGNNSRRKGERHFGRVGMAWRQCLLHKSDASRILSVLTGESGFGCQRRANSVQQDTLVRLSARLFVQVFSNRHAEPWLRWQLEET